MLIYYFFVAQFFFYLNLLCLSLFVILKGIKKNLTLRKYISEIKFCLLSFLSFSLMPVNHRENIFENQLKNVTEMKLF